MIINSNISLYLSALKINKQIIYKQMSNNEYIIETDKVSLKMDRVDGTFTMTVYDNNGHYLDDIFLDSLEIRDIYNALDKIKDNFC